MKKTGLAVLVGLLAAVLQLTAVASFSADSKTDQMQSDASATAPDFSLPVIYSGEGSNAIATKTLRLADLRGKAVVLNFWSIWSDGSKTEMSFLVDLQGQYGGGGVRIVGIASDDATQDEIAGFAKKMKANYPIVLGTDRVFDEYSADRVPTSIFIDRNGRIVAQELGLTHPATILEDFRRLVSESSETRSRATR